MRCSVCGRRIRKKDAYCPGCGTALFASPQRERCAHAGTQSGAWAGQADEQPDWQAQADDGQRSKQPDWPVQPDAWAAQADEQPDWQAQADDGQRSKQPADWAEHAGGGSKQPAGRRWQRLRAKGKAQVRRVKQYMDEWERSGDPQMDPDWEEDTAPEDAAHPSDIPPPPDAAKRPDGRTLHRRQKTKKRMRQAPPPKKKRRKKSDWRGKAVIALVVLVAAGIIFLVYHFFLQPSADGSGATPTTTAVRSATPTATRTGQTATPRPSLAAGKLPGGSEDPEQIIQRANRVYFSRQDLQALNREQTAYLRNGIYALSGKIFASASAYDAYFRSKDWYRPTTASDARVVERFNAYQKANLKLCLEYEQQKGWR